ncbi:MAG: phosphotransferase family protein [Gammaproteobacteria bacterium]
MAESDAGSPGESRGPTLAPDPDFRAVVARLIGADAETLAFEPLAGGVSSDIWRVAHGDALFCAKRALPRLRVAALWEAPVSRNAEEVRWLRTARAFIGPEVAEVIAHDAAAGVALLAWYPPETWQNWKQRLLAGTVDAGIGAALGTALGRIVARGASTAGLAADFDNGVLFDALRIDPFFRYLQDHFDGMSALVHDLETSRNALVHGDFSPKNVLVDDEGQIRILDAETATWGPAAFDPGYLIAHLLLKFERAADLRLLETACRFWSAYCAALQPAAATTSANVDPRRTSPSPRPTDRDVIRVIAGMLLARIDGKSPVDYLDDAVRNDLRARAAALLAQSTGWPNGHDDAHASVADLLLGWPALPVAKPAENTLTHANPKSS